MKTLRYISLILLSAFITITTQAQNNETLYIKAEKFTLPLIEKWISEYSQINPNAKIKVTNSDDEANVKLVLKSENIPSSEKIVYVGRYALLPVANKNNQVIEELNKNKLNKKIIKEFFFENDFPGNENKKIAKLKENTTVYSGNKANSGSVFFANYFGLTASDLRDKRISGDDVFLLSAIEKDQTGITINNLSYLYDLKTRKLKDNLAILPLDLKKEYASVLASDNLDQTIDLLQKEKVDLIPINEFGFVASKTTPVASQFLAWILKDGQQYNNDYGFLTLDNATLASQQKNVNNNYLTENKSK